MGQYHVLVNLKKREMVDPHKLGDGLKLHEQMGCSVGGVATALHLLLAVSSGRGGGDFQDGSPLIGSWAGDPLAVVGDYGEPGDIPGMPDIHAGEVYGLAQDAEDGENDWTDITEALISVIEREAEMVYWGDGWRDRGALFDVVEGWKGSHGLGDRTAMIGGHEFPMSKVMPAARKALAAKPHGQAKVTLADLHAHGLPECAVRGAE